MQIHRVFLTSLLVVGVTVAAAEGVGAQTPVKAAPAPTAAVQASLAQLMRSVPFPNSNIIFDVQDNDPATKPPDPKGPYIGHYQGWEGVENAALMLAEASNLILMPGRKCENGKPVPVAAPDFAKFAKALRTTGNEIYRAAQAKDRDKVTDLTDKIAETCANCHNKYREVAAGRRCMPN